MHGRGCGSGRSQGSSGALKTEGGRHGDDSVLFRMSKCLANGNSHVVWCSLLFLRPLLVLHPGVTAAEGRR
jgi:hypothetical protein